MQLNKFWLLQLLLVLTGIGCACVKREYIFSGFVLEKLLQIFQLFLFFLKLLGQFLVRFLFLATSFLVGVYQLYFFLLQLQVIQGGFRGLGEVVREGLEIGGKNVFVFGFLRGKLLVDINLVIFIVLMVLIVLGFIIIILEIFLGQEFVLEEIVYRKRMGFLLFYGVLLFVGVRTENDL
ncbi:hypothetical protein PPERSA_09078 [Pseudocohnilembus persalinus]|uniref:Uncharacterized protein n=1 Tax=Pseudocohnilembus persalinus TaxID=266149 RepID=A0A0V0Q7L0_PSEPJ|nr:hypothetical protein PPERSA_09078 [Pseudocohnilembus persalinus]|eukprot:KRW98138.1 hypothetical protein PPERSA_09078 [Pseudocohnilembus persalinus]